MMLKVLSVAQPWAQLIVDGNKKIETRTFNTNYRGELFIHASKTLFHSDLELCNEDKHFKKCIPDVTVLKSGYIIGKVNVVDSVPVEMLMKLTPQERAFGYFNPGRYGWILENPVKLQNPIEVLGALGIWNLLLPGTEVEFKIRGSNKTEWITGVIDGFEGRSYRVKSFHGSIYNGVSHADVKLLGKELANG
jgi:activating signal cointegrator 1